MNSNLEYTSDGLSNRYLFFKSNFDIVFFVEDTGKEYFYETLFERILKNNKSYTFKIITTGGKNNLIENFSKYGALYLGTNNIYIADCDFDRIINESNMILNRNFIYLQHYNIECYFIDEKSTILYVKGLIKKTDLEIKNELDFNYWRSKINNELFELFILYCTIQRCEIPLENVGTPIGKIIKNETGFIFDDYYLSVYNTAKSSLADIDIELEHTLKKVLEVYPRNKFSIICGKYYLYSLRSYLNFYLKNKNNSKESVRKKEFENFLLNTIPRSVFNDLLECITDIVG